MKVFHLIAGCILLSAPSTFAQSSFQKTYDAGNVEDGRSLRQTIDGGYALFGNTTNGSVTSALLIRTDETGNELWQQTYNGAAGTGPSCFDITADSGFILCGGVDSFQLIRTDVSGNEMWNRLYFDSSAESMSGVSVEQTIDGGYIAVGNIKQGTTAEQVYLLKLNASGDELWHKTFFGTVTGSLHANKVMEAGNGYVFGGSIDSTGGGSHHMFLAKTDLNGNVVWNHIYFSPNDIVGKSFDVTSDSGFIIAGPVLQPSTEQQTEIIRVNPEGEELWREEYGISGPEFINDVKSAPDEGFIFAGYLSTSPYKLAAFKTNDSGVVEWNYIADFAANTTANSVISASDGGYSMLGQSYVDVGQDGDFFLLKTTSLGVVGVPPVIAEESVGNIFPNPFHKTAVLSMPGFNSQELLIEISDAGGNVLQKSKSTTGNTVTINRGDLPAGTYFVSVYDQERLVMTEKMVIQ